MLECTNALIEQFPLTREIYFGVLHFKSYFHDRFFYLFWSIRITARPPYVLVVLKKNNWMSQEDGEKYQRHESVNVSVNFIEIFRMICNLGGMQFAELSRFCLFYVNKILNFFFIQRTHRVVCLCQIILHFSPYKCWLHVPCVSKC